MNTKLLHRVALAILDEPTKFDMQLFVAENENSPCGTTACIAGFAVAMSRGLASLRSLFGIDIESSAQNIIGLSDRTADRLFYKPLWPVDFYQAYNDAENAYERAEIAFWRIQHFIATEGEE